MEALLLFVMVIALRMIGTARPMSGTCRPTSLERAVST